MAVGPQHQPERGTHRAIEAEHRVRRHPAEQGSRGLAIEARTGQPDRRSHGRQPEPGKQQGMPRNVHDRPEELRGEVVGGAGERPEQPAPGASVVAAEAGRRGRQRPLEHHDAAAVERLRERRVRVHELDPVRREVHRAEERRGQREGHDRRAHVVAEPGEGQLPGPCAAADGRGRLVDPHRSPGPGKGDGRGEAVRPRADDDRVERRAVHRPTGRISSAARPCSPGRRCS